MISGRVVTVHCLYVCVCFESVVLGKNRQPLNRCQYSLRSFLHHTHWQFMFNNLNSSQNCQLNISVCRNASTGPLVFLLFSLNSLSWYIGKDNK
jgi:hypothetical protein